MINRWTDVHINPLRLDDLEEVMLIEPTAFGTHHWSRQSFVQELNKPEAQYFVARNSESKELVGYSGFWILGDESHITTLAVHIEHRRKRIGEQLLINNIFASRKHGASKLTLEVRASNKAAQNLYSKYGFKAFNIRPHYYQDNFENAYILWSDDITTPEFDSMLSNRIAEIQKEYTLASSAR